MTEFNDPDPSTYVPPPHRIAAIGNAWDTVDERITTVDDGPDTVNERLSDGGPGPEGQPATVRERLSGHDDDGSKRPSPKSSKRKS